MAQQVPGGAVATIWPESCMTGQREMLVTAKPDRAQDCKILSFRVKLPCFFVCAEHKANVATAEREASGAESENTSDSSGLRAHVLHM